MHAIIACAWLEPRSFLAQQLVFPPAPVRAVDAIHKAEVSTGMQAQLSLKHPRKPFAMTIRLQAHDGDMLKCCPEQRSHALWTQGMLHWCQHRCHRGRKPGRARRARSAYSYSSVVAERGRCGMCGSGYVENSSRVNSTWEDNRAGHPPLVHAER